MIFGAFVNAILEVIIAGLYNLCYFLSWVFMTYIHHMILFMRPTNL